MAKYTIISDIGRGLTSLLRDKLVPEPIDKLEKIGICEPKDRGDYTVGIHPYDIREDTSGQRKDPIPLPDGNIQDPPAMLELYYMISVCSKAQVEVRSAEESRIIGRVIQVFKDNPIIPQRYMPPSTNVESVPVSNLPIEMEEKVKIWTMFGESYKLSVFYVVGPVAIDSEILRKPQKRVETVLLSSIQYRPRKIVQFETRIKEEDIEDEYTEPKDEEEEEEDSSDESEEGEDKEEDSLGDSTEDESLEDELEENADEDTSEDENKDKKTTKEDDELKDEEKKTSNNDAKDKKTTEDDSKSSDTKPTEENDSLDDDSELEENEDEELEEDENLDGEELENDDEDWNEDGE